MRSLLIKANGVPVSVPWSGFINRKVMRRLKMDKNLFLFQSRGRDLLIGKTLVLYTGAGIVRFSPVVGIY